MANIPVERTSTGTPWWLWLLGLLLLIGLIWLLAGLFDDNDEDVAVVDDVEVVDPVDVDPVDVDATAPVVAGAMDMASLYVTRVPGDRTFFVSPTEGGTDETLVVLDQNMSPGVAGIEGQVDINPGQMVDLSDGTMMAVGDLDMDAMDFGDADMTAINGLGSTAQVIMIDGGDVEIMEADMENVEVDE